VFARGQRWHAHCIHKVRDQICAPLIDVLHLRPALIDSLLQTDQAIVTAANCKSHRHSNEEQDEKDNDATEGESIHTIVNRS